MIDAGCVRDFNSSESSYQFAAQQVMQSLTGSASKPFTLALSGGSSPIPLFELLSQGAQIQRIPWKRVAIFWVDERFVPPDHEQSNYGLAKKWLLDHVPLPPGHIFPMHTEYSSPEAAAWAYEQTLRSLFNTPDFPRFDMILLGMGSDGHIASLFPGDAALVEANRWVVAVPGPGMEPMVPRLTLTLPVLKNAKKTLVLVFGSGKREAFLEASTDPRSTLPAALLVPQGEISWLTCFCE